MVDYDEDGFELRDFDPNNILECRYMLEKIEELDNDPEVGFKYVLYPVQPGSYNVRLEPYNVRPGAYNVRPGAYNIRPGPYNVRPGFSASPTTLIQYLPWPLYDHPKFDFARIILNHMYDYRKVFKEFKIHYCPKYQTQIPIYHREKSYVTNSSYHKDIREAMKGIDLNQPQSSSNDVDCLLERLKQLKRNHKRALTRLHFEVVIPQNM
jgi:hypothetical protein